MKNKINHKDSIDTADEESYYIKNKRKEDKQNKKIASSTDRSRFKKTDQKQILLKRKQQDEIKIQKKTLQLGRVISIAPDAIKVESVEQIFICTLRGSLKKEVTKNHNLLAVGDLVKFKIEDPKQFSGTIAHVEKRKSILSRPNSFSRHKEQILATNIDRVLITVSVADPPLQTSVIDRYIIAAKKGNMTPILIINKIDLLGKGKQKALSTPDKDTLQQVIDIYSSLDIVILTVSVLNETGLNDLKESMHNKTSVFSGQSGVGKSSLINVLTHSNLPVGAVTKKRGKGSHTTTSAQLIRLDDGGWCIDTPGIESFVLGAISVQELESFFTDIHKIGRSCKYANCLHLKEPNCAVTKAVEEKTLSGLRFESYKKLIQQTLKGKKIWQ